MSRSVSHTMSSDQPPAIILAHPSAQVRVDPIPPDHRDHPVIDPYRATAESLAFSKSEAAKERAEVDAALRADELRRLDGVQALTLLVEIHGAWQVQSWLRNVAAMRGETI